MTNTGPSLSTEQFADLKAKMAKPHFADYGMTAHDGGSCDRCLGERLLVDYFPVLVSMAERCGHAEYMRRFVETQNDILNATIAARNEQLMATAKIEQDAKELARKLAAMEARADRAERTLQRIVDKGDEYSSSVAKYVLSTGVEPSLRASNP